jgi:Flp pilus assembly protein TadG
MNWKRIRRRCASHSGQSLLETALLLPLILLLTFYALNFGYFFVVALQLASAPREGVQYAIQGPSTPAHVVYADAGPSTDTSSISYLTYRDMSMLTGSSTTAVQVCSSSIGLVNAGTVTQTAQCSAFGSAANPAFLGPASDPESPLFVTFRVDVQYKIQPLINGFGMLMPNLTFHRQVSMRSM